MTMFKTYAPLIFILVVVIGVAQWDESQTAKEKNEAETSNLVFDYGEGREISSLWFQNEEQEIKLEKSEGEWGVVEPLVTRADPDTISQFLNQIKVLKYHKIVTSDKSRWQEFGVAGEPHFKVGVAGHEVGVIVGDDAPVGMESYIRLSGKEDVLLVSQAFKLMTSKSLFNLRFKGVVDKAVADIDEFSYEDEQSGKITFNRDDAGEWQLFAPGSLTVDRDAFIDYISWLGAMKAIGFIDNPGPKDLERFEVAPLLKLSWLTKSDEVQTLLFVESEQNILAKYVTGNRVFLLDLDILGSLKKSLRDFKDRRLIKVDMAKVKKVSLDTKEFARNGTTWFEGSSTNEDPKILNWFVELEYAKFTEEISDADELLQDIGEPLHFWQLFGADGEVLADIRLWRHPRDHDRFIAKVEGRSSHFVIGPELVSELADKSSAQSHDHDEELESF